MHYLAEGVVFHVGHIAVHFTLVHLWYVWSSARICRERERKSLYTCVNIRARLWNDRSHPAHSSPSSLLHEHYKANKMVSRVILNVEQKRS